MVFILHNYIALPFAVASEREEAFTVIPPHLTDTHPFYGVCSTGTSISCDEQYSPATLELEERVDVYDYYSNLLQYDEHSKRESTDLGGRE